MDMLAGTGSDDAGMVWTVHPAAEQPLRAVILIVIVLAASALATRASGSNGLGLAALVFLAVSLRTYFLPRTYTLDAGGAAEDGLLTARRRLAWDDVRRVSTSRFGVHLSPRLSDSRLLPDRGLFLRSESRRAEIEAYATAHMRHGDTATTGSTAGMVHP